jgi:hypothetical protein
VRMRMGIGPRDGKSAGQHGNEERHRDAR